ncbi:MAG: hypothetical protein GWP08_21135 [Nitrospiraceae bacterium]|nr:hypothetical protein [Nitrospiraceae bacterium]
MDLSFLKWPVIIGVVILIGWLGSSGGVNYMYGKFTADQPGVNAEKDAVNEAGLSRLGGYCLKLFKYEKAAQIFRESIDRFPGGENRWYNQYRMVKCAEKGKRYRQAVNLMKELMAVNAHGIDSRVPDNKTLNLRAEKLIELHNLERR